MAKNDNMMLTKFRNAAKYFLVTVEVCLCIAIINVVYWELTAYWWSYDGTTVYYACLLGDNDKGSNMCTYTYTLAGVSMATAILFVCSACIPCTCWKYMDLIYDGAMVIFHLLWWLAGVIILANYNASASDKQKSIQTSSRDAVAGMTWTMFALVCVDYGIWQFIVFYNICGYFGGRKAKEQRETEKAQDHQDEMMANGALNPVMAPKVELEHIKP